MVFIAYGHIIMNLQHMQQTKSLFTPCLHFQCLLKFRIFLSFLLIFWLILNSLVYIFSF